VALAAWHGRGRWGLARRTLGVAVLLGGVIWTYAYVCSAGKLGEQWPAYMYFYDEQGEGFRQGHLYIPQEPHPDLLKQANPYDPAHVKLWKADASLYRGKYYMYWGPLPALLQAAGKELLQVDRMVGDQYLVFFFCSLCAVFGILLIGRVARRLFVATPRTLVVAGMLAFAFANPVTHLLATGGVYQAAIAGGQAFLLLGVLFAFDAVWEGPADPKLRRRLLLAGVAWGLALGCRVSLAPAVVLLGLVTAWATGWVQGGWRRFLAHGIPMALPVALSSVGLLWYNKRRFDSWFNFGTSLQLTTWKYSFSSKFIEANLYSYALRPFETGCEFPQVRQIWHPKPEVMPDWISIPKGYQLTEPLVGWLRVVPVTWVGVVAVVAAVVAVWHLSRRRVELEARVRHRWGYVWCVACFVVLGTAAGFADLGLFLATMRYLGDFTNGLVLLGVMGAFTLYSAMPRRALRGIVQGLVVAGCTATVGFGLMLGFQGYIDHFKRYNAGLHARMVAALSICPDGGTGSPAAERWTNPGIK
jgi:hypothetical protein